MESAAESWVDFFENSFEEAGKAIVIAGKGNNGGDGFVIARLLLENGWDVEVVTVEGWRAMTEDCKEAERLWRKEKMGVKTVACPEEWMPDEDAVLVDALFGVGLSRSVEGDFLWAVQEMQDRPNGDERGR